MMQLLINGIDRTNKWLENTLSISDSIGGRSTGNVRLYSKDYLNLENGMDIVFKDDENIIFSGIIEDIEETQQTAREGLFYTLDFVDYQGILDRRIVAQTYTNEFAGDIVQDLIDRILFEENITVGHIEQGEKLSRAVFPYIYASQVMDELAEQTGFNWYVDDDKRLFFVNRQYSVSSNNITDNSQIRDLSVTKTKEDYRNRQYIRAGQDVTDVLTERFSGDNERKTFTVGFKLAEKPLIYVNDVQVDENMVGIRGLDTDKEWYWSKEEKEITQDNFEPPLSTTDVLRVDYRGFFPIIVTVDEPSEISRTQTVEGGSGVYEQVTNRSDIDDRQYALDVADSKLRKYARIQGRMTFSIDKPLFKAGDVFQVDLSYHNISSEFLVESVNITDLNEDTFRYSINAVDGEALGGWENFFMAIAKEGAQLSIRENEVLVVLNVIRESQGWNELVLTPAPQKSESRSGWEEEKQTQVYACPIPRKDEEFWLGRRQPGIDGLFPSENLYPC